MKAARNKPFWARADEVLKSRRVQTFVKGTLLVIVWIVPGYLLTSVHHSLEYDFVQNVRVAASQDGNFLLPLKFGGFEFIPEHQGGEILKLVLVKLTGVEIESLQYFPVGAILVHCLSTSCARSCWTQRLRRCFLFQLHLIPPLFLVVIMLPYILGPGSSCWPFCSSM